MHIEDRKSSNKYIIGNEDDFSFKDFSYISSISKGSPINIRAKRADKNGSDRMKTGVV